MNFSELSSKAMFLIFVNFGNLDLGAEGGPEDKLVCGDIGVALGAAGP